MHHDNFELKILLLYLKTESKETEQREDSNSYRKTQQDATVYQNFIIPYFKWSSSCFGRHAAHHQEPKTAQAASGFP